jgi:hypothetical protein
MAVTDPTAIGAPTGTSGAVTGGFGQGTPAGFQYTGQNLPGTPNINISDMAAPSYTNTQPADSGGFLQSPTGQLLQAAVPLAVGQYGAGQQAQNIQQLTNQMRAQVTPLAQYGQGVLGQVQGGAPVAGPAGQIIGDQLQGAQALTQAAQPYASGQLTQGQQLALQQAAQGAAARTNLIYGMSGNPLSSANIQAQQAIGNQAVIAADQVRQQNIQFAQQALQSAQGVYNGILQQSLSSAELGLAGFGPAVAQQIKADQQIGSSMQSLYAQIAQGLTASNPNAPGGPSAGQQFGNIFQKMLSGNTSGAVNQPATQSTDSGWGSGYQWGAGPGGSDYAPGVSAPDVTPTGGTDTSQQMTDLSAGTPDWLPS